MHGHWFRRTGRGVTLRVGALVLEAGFFEDSRSLLALEVLTLAGCGLLVLAGVTILGLRLMVAVDTG